MLLQSILRQLLILRARASVVGIRIDADATARGEETRNFDIFRIHEFDQVLHNHVYAVLVEVAVVAEAK